MKIDVLFLLEHEDREGESIRRLAKELKECYGFSSAILSIEFSLYQIYFFRPKIVIVPYFLNERSEPERTIYMAYGNNIPIVNMNWEQLLSSANWEFKRPKTDFCLNTLVHFAWGESFKGQLLESGVNKGKIFVTGNIATFLLSELSKNYHYIRKDFSQKYALDLSKEWVFLPMNYGWAFSSDETIKLKISKGYDPEVAWEYRRYSRSCLSEFIFFVKNLSKTGKYELIIRPHPSISVEQYIEAFVNHIGKVPESVIFCKDFSIREWISCSDLIGSSWSSSVWDASNIGKKCFLFTPYERPGWLNVWWNDEVENISSVEAISGLSVRGSSDTNNAIKLTAKAVYDLVGNAEKYEKKVSRRYFFWSKRCFYSFVKSFFMRFLGGYRVAKGIQRDYFKTIIVR